MTTEQIYKLQPDRTFYLRGFTGFGAAASLCQTSPTGSTVCGVFRDMADFCVLVLYDADNTFEHYSVRYLPDFDLSGIKLSFDLTYQGLQPIDSARYSWIDWSQMDVITVDKTNKDDAVSRQIRLWDYATLKSNNYTVAQGVYRLTAPGNCAVYDRLTLYINDVIFDFASAKGGETAAYVAKTLANGINNHDWSTYADTASVVIATADDSGTLTLKNARTGHVTVSGTTVSWLDGIKFPGIAPGSSIYLGGTGFMVASVDSPTSLTLTSPAPSLVKAVYLAEYGGVDGNSVTTYMVVRPGNQTLAVDTSTVSLTGGNSDNVTWTISLDFSTLQIDQIRQAWLTFAPQLTPGADYSATEWSATITNWRLDDPLSLSKLQCAGPGSVRTGNDADSACTYSGAGWSTLAANNYWHGFGKTTATPGDSVSITYTCNSTHQLYLGTSLNKSGGAVGVSLDGDSVTQQSCLLPVASEVVTRRLLRNEVSAGTHTVVLSVIKPGSFVFDYIEAAMPGDIPAPLQTYQNVSPALDFDTDATYKVSPQRLLWHLSRLGFAGQINEYLGVFWWNQRKRVGGIWTSFTVTFAGIWAANDTANIILNSGTSSEVSFKKTVTTWDTLDSIAAHFVYYINSGSIIVRALKTGPGQLTLYTRTPNWTSTFSAASVSSSGSVQTALSGQQQNDGTWQVDTTADNPLNYPVRQWHSDFFSAAKSQGLLVTTAFSMELVNPPADDQTPANTWVARFYDGSSVETDTGFAHLNSTQCAPVPNLTSFQGKAFAAMAKLQSDAGLTPWLQFGEFLWWFFSSMPQAVGYCSFTDPISIGLANAHGMQTGDRVVITGVQGCTAANGTWPITVTDATHFTVPVPANADWQAGTGQIRGGSMAYYDAYTSVAAQNLFGRPLYRFTCQDDDPTINGGADAGFLAGQLKAHVDGIRSTVLAQFPETKFEILYPNDVNNPVCYLGKDVQFPQGGRLNAAVNLPTAWMTKAGSGLDRFKVEALSWGSTYLNLDLANEAITFALTPQLSWQAADVAYLVPWFNGTCPWPHEFHAASSRGIALINFWAYDHLALMSWPLPFSLPNRTSFRKI